MPRRSRSQQRPSDQDGPDETKDSGDTLPHSDERRPREETLVKLNVGGHKFETTEATLFSQGKPNFLTSLLTSHLPTIRDSHGRYFIDRSGSLFEILLEYLRTSVLHIPANISPQVRRFHSPSTFLIKGPPYGDSTPTLTSLF